MNLSTQARTMQSGFVSAQPLRTGGGLVTSTPALCARSRRTFMQKRNARTVITATSVPVEIDEKSFQVEVLSSELPVLVDFHASWCGPCKLMSPLMEWAASEYEGKIKVVKVDTENSESLVKEYDIHGLPTLAVFREGKAYGVKEGAMGLSDLTKYITTHIPEL